MVLSEYLITNIHEIPGNAQSKWIGNTAHFWLIFLILFPGSVMKCGLNSSPFCTILRTLLLLVKLTFMVITLSQCGEALLLICLCFIWLRVTIFSLGVVLIYIFMCSEIKAYIDHYSFIQKEMDWLLLKCICGS